MRVIVHVGMPKTGTSAIQAAFHGLKRPEFETLEWRGINHYPLLMTLYGGPETGHPVFWPQGATGPSTADRIRTTGRARMDAQIARLAGTDATLLISAEGLWTPAADRILSGLIADLGPRADRIEALAYIRPPLSWTTSSFQQRLKHIAAVPALDIERMWPRYRPRIEALDARFGIDALRLRPFRRSLLAEGDVVVDFARVVGLEPPVPLPSAPAPNESLSAEATALLHLQRRKGRPFEVGAPEAVSHLARFVEALRPIGSRTLAFAPDLVARARRAAAADLAWTEERLGASLAESGAVPEGAIRSDEDLVMLAVASREALRSRIGQMSCEAVAPRGGDLLDETLALLETLRVLTVVAAGPGPAPSQPSEGQPPVEGQEFNLGNRGTAPCGGVEVGTGTPSR